MKLFGKQDSKVNKKLEKPKRKLDRKKVNWMHSDWKSAFTPIKRRTDMAHMLKYLTLGVLSAMGLILLIFILSFLIPIEKLWQYSLASGLLTVIFALVVGWIKRPSIYETARATDKFGLNEKVLTACELDDRDDLMANMQRADTIKTLSKFDKKRISLRIPKSYGAVFLLLALALIMTSLIPNPMDRLIQGKKELKAEIEKQLEELKETEKELAAEEGISEEQRQELAKLVDELAEQLKNTGDYKEALKEISKAEDGLAALTDKIREESIGRLAEQLGFMEETRAVAQALSDRSPADLERALEQLKEQLEQAENKEALAESLQEALEKAMESMSDGQIKSSLASASKSLSSGQTGVATEQLGDAMKQAIDASNSMGDAKYALQQMRSSIARAAGDSQYAQSSGNTPGQNGGSSNGNSGENNSGNGQGSGEGQGQGQGSGEGQGQGSGQGQGQGSGEGQGQGQGSGQGQGQGQGSGQGQSSGQGQGTGQGSGSGVGNGTTNQGSGQGGSGTTGQNGDNQQGDGNAQTVYEQIYAPERLGDGGDVTNVPGQNSGQGDTVSEEDGRGVGNLAGFIPYKEVYQEYRNEAMNSMDRRVLPPNIQDMVREYFDALGN